MRNLIFATLVAVAGLFPVVSGHADDPAAPQSSSADHASMTQKKEALKSACADDINKFCSDVTPGKGRVAECIDSHDSQLSPGCKTAWTDTKARISQKMDKANVAFRKECGSDIQKFCADVPEGRGRILDCLAQHQDSLSNTCKNLQAKIKEKASAYIG